MFNTCLQVIFKSYFYSDKLYSNLFSMAAYQKRLIHLIICISRNPNMFFILEQDSTVTEIFKYLAVFETMPDENKDSSKMLKFNL